MLHKDPEAQREARRASKRAWALQHPERHRASQRAWVLTHPERYRAAQLAWSHRHPGQKRRDLQKARALRQAFVDAVHAGGCVDCGNKNLNVLESDHVRGIKSAAIATMISAMRPLAVLFSELEKCETRCANCHRIATNERRKEAA